MVKDDLSRNDIFYAKREDTYKMNFVRCKEKSLDVSLIKIQNFRLNRFGLNKFNSRESFIFYISVELINAEREKI